LTIYFRSSGNYIYHLLLHSKLCILLTKCVGCFSSYLTDKCRPDALMSFDYTVYRLLSVRWLSSSRHRLLYLPDTQRTTQLWQSVRRSFGPAHIGQASKKRTPDIYVLHATVTLNVCYLAIPPLTNWFGNRDVLCLL
jgi:hypothetical protein